MLRLLPALLLLALPAAAAPLPMGRGALACSVEETAAATTIHSHPTVEKKAAVLREKDAPDSTLRIEWLNQEPAPTGFAIERGKGGKSISSSHHLGRTGITRTLLVTDEAIFIHIVADQPGAVALKASLTSTHAGKTTLRDRNEILWNEADGGPRKAYLRVIPFESDVEADGESIVLRGEGECLLVVGFSMRDDPQKPLEDLWKRLCAAHDPGAEHPDPVKIWHAVLAGEAAP